MNVSSPLIFLQDLVIVVVFCVFLSFIFHFSQQSLLAAVVSFPLQLCSLSLLFLSVAINNIFCYALNVAVQFNCCRYYSTLPLLQLVVIVIIIFIRISLLCVSFRLPSSTPTLLTSFFFRTRITDFSLYVSKIFQFYNMHLIFFVLLICLHQRCSRPHTTS